MSEKAAFCWVWGGMEVGGVGLGRPMHSVKGCFPCSWGNVGVVGVGHRGAHVLSKQRPSIVHGECGCGGCAVMDRHSIECHWHGWGEFRWNRAGVAPVHLGVGRAATVVWISLCHVTWLWLCGINLSSSGGPQVPSPPRSGVREDAGLHSAWCPSRRHTGLYRQTWSSTSSYMHA